MRRPQLSRGRKSTWKVQDVLERPSIGWAQIKGHMAIWEVCLVWDFLEGPKYGFELTAAALTALEAKGNLIGPDCNSFNLAKSVSNL